MIIIITRHGETEENKKRIIQGHMPGHLSEKGKKQSMKVAERLRNEKIDCIYSSDLARAADTAKEISKFHPDTPLILTKELRERKLGEYEGLSGKSLDWEKIRKDWENPKEGESKKKMAERAERFIEKIIEEHKNQAVLLVGHDGIDKALIKSIDKNVCLDKHLGNTSISVFKIESGERKTVLINCTKHLEGLGTDWE